MINKKRWGVGVFCICLFVVVNAYAGLPTLDVGNVAASGSIVKNGSENIGIIGKITGKVGELNTIVGDGAASIAKFQADYGESIQSAIEAGKKGLKRAQEMKAALEEHRAEIQEQKDAYQAAIDSLESQKEAKNGVEDGVDEAEDIEEESPVREVYTSGEFMELAKEGEKQDDSLMTSANKVYNDDDEQSLTIEKGMSEAGETEEFEDGVPDGVSQEEMQQLPSVTNLKKGVVGVSQPAVLKAQSKEEAVGKKVLKGVDSVENVASVEKEETVKGAEKEEPVQPVLQRRKFRTSPTLKKIDKVSSVSFHRSEKIGFASASDNDNIGNAYVGDVYIVPMAQRCEISAETFINDENQRKSCIEKIIRENNADNSFDSALSMKDCQKMIYDAVVALLAEATNSKYEAANYSDTLDEQDGLAGDSTDVRGDLTVIAMSNQQTQLLLNRLSMSFSSQIILETAEHLCALQKDVLGDSDLDEDTETDGEK